MGKWGAWVEIFSLSDSEMGRGEDGITVTHEIEVEFNYRGEFPTNFDVEIEGLGQKWWVIGPGSASIEHSYTLSGGSSFSAPPSRSFSGSLRARARSHSFTALVDARITYR